LQSAVGLRKILDMHKRPWPLVILAIFQLLTPVGSLLFSSIANQMDVFSFTQDLWQNGNWVTKFSVFGLPPILAGLIYFTRRMGLFLLTAAVLAQTGMNIVTWGRATNSMSLSMLVLVSVINLALIAYLLLPSVREIFFNPDIRWWERQPRYILNAPAEIIFEGGVRSCFIHDLSRGGASLECNPGQITPGGAEVQDAGTRTCHQYPRRLRARHQCQVLKIWRPKGCR
jgi:hypothetical protein